MLVEAAKFWLGNSRALETAKSTGQSSNMMFEQAGWILNEAPKVAGMWGMMWGLLESRVWASSNPHKPHPTSRFSLFWPTHTRTRPKRGKGGKRFSISFNPNSISRPFTFINTQMSRYLKGAAIVVQVACGVQLFKENIAEFTWVKHSTGKSCFVRKKKTNHSLMSE